MSLDIHDAEVEPAAVVVTGLALPPTKMELRRARAEEQRIDAGRVRSEMTLAVADRDAKTVRLRALRLAKEAADREIIAAMPPKPKRRVRKAVTR